MSTGPGPGHPVTTHDTPAGVQTTGTPDAHPSGPARREATLRAVGDAAALRRQLEPRWPGLQVEVVAQCASTNTELLQRARVPGFAPTLLIAQVQTGGRGRQGRAWLSAPGASLTFSLALPLAPRDWQGLSLAVGVAVADALEPGGHRLALKWPNDLWLRDEGGLGRKLGGILIETVMAGGERVAVIGVGLNVRPLPAPIDVDTGLASLQELNGGADATTALAALAPALLDGLGRFEAEGFAAFAPAFARRDLLRGRRVSAPAAGIVDGHCEGVDDDGALRVHDGQRLRRVVSGEVSVRPLPDGPERPRC